MPCLELSVKAREAGARVVVFCGVDFMAEQAAALNENAVVLHPDPEARCPMAAMITVGDVLRARKLFPKAPVVMYVNSPAVVKAEADYIVTSANAVDAVKALASLGVKRIVLRTYKNAKAFDQATLKELGFAEVRERTKVFEGRGDVAVKLFPANVNVVAVLALASGRIPWVEVYADSALSVNVHEIEIESEAPSIRVRVENVPHPRNPRTSYLVALSAIRLLKQLSEDAYIHVGT